MAADSLFHYHSSNTYDTFNSDTASFAPPFGLSLLENNSALHDLAVAQCDGDHGCLYDTGVSGNLTFGLATHKVREAYDAVKTELGISTFNNSFVYSLCWHNNSYYINSLVFGPIFDI